jgi:hypothetical protein
MPHERKLVGGDTTGGDGSRGRDSPSANPQGETSGSERVNGSSEAGLFVETFGCILEREHLP